MAKTATKSKPAAEKREPGRPSKYEPGVMLPKLQKIGANGGSKAEMAFALGISRDTLFTWAKEKREFSDALKGAELASQAWWEERGRIRTFDAKDFNATSYIFQMKNRFPDDWRDRSAIEHTGKDGAPLVDAGGIVEDVVRALTGKRAPDKKALPKA